MRSGSSGQPEQANQECSRGRRRRPEAKDLETGGTPWSGFSHAPSATHYHWPHSDDAVNGDGFFYLTGTLDNSGNTLALNDSTGSLYLQYGTIRGGTVTTAGSAELASTNHMGTLAGVTLAGTLDLTSPIFISATVAVTGGLTLNQGSIKLAGAQLIDLPGFPEPGRHGNRNPEQYEFRRGLVVPNAGDTLTILPGVTVQGSSGVVGSSGGGLIANQGTIAAQGGGSLTVQGFTNFTGGTLTGGTWEAVGGSTLRLLGANVVTDAATIVLDGVGSQLDSDSNSTNALAGLTAITASGGLSLQNGAGLSASGVSNAGAVTIGTGSSFPVAGYTQTGGSTTLQGGSLGATTLSIQGGTSSGSGTVNGNLTNAAQVSPGSSSPGVLTINGNYTQTAAGALSLKVGGATAGTQFDQLNITGTASLNGTLNVSLIDGFGPSAEESFDVLNFASSTGNFATLNFPLIGGSPAFVTNSTPTSLNLVATTSAPTWR